MKRDVRWFIMVEGTGERFPIFGGTKWIPAYSTKKAAEHAYRNDEIFQSHREQFPNAKVSYKRVGMPWYKVW
jgi:hypothetical protein